MLRPAARWLFLGILVAVVGFDQVTKHWALATFHVGRAVEVLPFLKFTLAFNEGIGWSMFSFLWDWMEKGSQIIFGMVNAIISLIIIFVFRSEQRIIALVGWSMVVAGAIGNAIDRFVTLFTWRTGVVDFISVHWAHTHHFPVFNIADCAITLGFAVVLLDMLFLDRQKPAVA